MNYPRVITLIGLLTLTACQPKGGGLLGSATPGDNKPPVATVNGEPIGHDFFEFYVKGVAGKPSSELTSEQRDQLLDNLVRGKLVAQEALKDGLPKETDTASMLELQRMNVLEQAVSERYLKDKKPTEQELRSEYETQVTAIPRQEYHARHILVATEPFAQKLIAELDKGAKFDEVAKRESMDSSKEAGGDLGWFTPERMVKPFADALKTLKPGQYTHTPVKTPFGWHIIKLEDTREVSPPPYDQVRQRLEQSVLQKKFKSYTDELLKTAKVDKKLETAAPAPAAQAKPEKPKAG
jgi:peptidyl-prolyl cis-trans isomerase C